MNIKNIVRILNFILLIFILFSFCYQVSAGSNYLISPWSGLESFENARVSSHNTLATVIRTPTSYIISFIRTIAVIVAICMILWAAVRYMAPNFSLFGKALDKAEVKRDIPRLIIGSVLLFGTSGFLTFIQYIIDDIFT